MATPKIIPVIHYLDRETAFAEAGTAMLCGADGVFLISHHGNDQVLMDVALAIQQKHPGFPVGINLLSTTPVDAALKAINMEFPMLWGDDMGVDSTGLNDIGTQVAAIGVGRKSPALKVFASVAFKYRPYEPDPAKAALNALKAGFIPTTSGSGTGSAPDLEKIVAMSQATGGVLAIASGMTPWNVAEYAPFLSHILVATGISLDEHRMDADKLHLLIANARAAVPMHAMHNPMETIMSWQPINTAPRNGTQFLLLPSPKSTAWISAWWTKGGFHETARGVPLTVDAGALWHAGPELPRTSSVECHQALET